MSVSAVERTEAHAQLGDHREASAPTTPRSQRRPNYCDQDYCSTIKIFNIISLKDNTKSKPHNVLTFSRNLKMKTSFQIIKTIITLIYYILLCKYLDNIR